MIPVDAIELAVALVRCPSVTPADAGAMDVLEAALSGLGFACRRLRFDDIENIYARLGAEAPNLCFGGHTDVVPPGHVDDWRHDPFAAHIEKDILHGRGVVDMKGAVAAFVGAVSNVLAKAPPKGSISLLITGDEERPGHDCARRMVDLLRAEGESVDHCLVGEPTSASQLGDMIKVGRRGSVNVAVTVDGVQGHVAYPDRAANPVPILVRLLLALQSRQLDEGYPQFQASHLEITDVSVGNPSHNVIPARATAKLNIRFNPHWTGAALSDWIETESRLAEAGFSGRIELDFKYSGEPFYTAPGPFTEVVAQAVTAVTGQAPAFSTSGGTSDARFIQAMCPVVELGLVGTSMHMVDEQAPIAEIRTLQRIYEGVLDRYYDAFGALPV